MGPIKVIIKKNVVRTLQLSRK